MNQIIDRSSFKIYRKYILITLPKFYILVYTLLILISYPIFNVEGSNQDPNSSISLNKTLNIEIISKLNHLMNQQWGNPKKGEVYFIDTEGNLIQLDDPNFYKLSSEKIGFFVLNKDNKWGDAVLDLPSEINGQFKWFFGYFDKIDYLYYVPSPKYAHLIYQFIKSYGLKLSMNLYSETQHIDTETYLNNYLQYKMIPLANRIENWADLMYFVHDYMSHFRTLLMKSDSILMYYHHLIQEHQSVGKKSAEFYVRLIDNFITFMSFSYSHIEKLNQACSTYPFVDRFTYDLGHSFIELLSEENQKRLNSFKNVENLPNCLEERGKLFRETILLPYLKDYEFTKLIDIFTNGIKSEEEYNKYFFYGQKTLKKIDGLLKRYKTSINIKRKNNFASKSLIKDQDKAQILETLYSKENSFSIKNTFKEIILNEDILKNFKITKQMNHVFTHRLNQFVVEKIKLMNSLSMDEKEKKCELLKLVKAILIVQKSYMEAINIGLRSTYDKTLESTGINFNHLFGSQKTIYNEFGDFLYHLEVMNNMFSGELVNFNINDIMTNFHNKFNKMESIQNIVNKIRKKLNSDYGINYHKHNEQKISDLTYRILCEYYLIKITTKYLFGPKGILNTVYESTHKNIKMDNNFIINDIIAYLERIKSKYNKEERYIVKSSLNLIKYKIFPLIKEDCTTELIKLPGES